MKKITKALSILLVFALVLGLAACANDKNSDNNASKTYKIGICNYVDDASLNQIYENIEAQLKVICFDDNRDCKHCTFADAIWLKGWRR